MKKTRHTEEQIAFALKQAETGTPVAEVMGDDTSRVGNPLVVFGNVAERAGSLTTNTSKGPLLLAVMGDMDYTPEALRRLATSTQVAFNIR